MRPPFLLDTCAALWFTDASLPRPTVQALTEACNLGLSTFISPITAFEVGQLARKRRFKSQLTPLQWFERLLGMPGMALADLPPAVFIASSELPHCDAKDPSNRIIAATAREYGYTVVTRDRALLEYGKQGYLSVLEC